MTAAESSLREEALGWLIRVNEPDFDQWDAFHEWLESDAAHSQCYWRLARAEADAAADLQASPAIPTHRPPAAKFRWIMAGAGVAAAAALAFMMVPRHQDDLLIQTAPGVTRSVILHDGSRIDVNGASRVRIAQGGERRIRLDNGEAMFTVAHDPQHPFTVEIDGHIVRDVGTVFDVVRRDDGVLAISVARGAVLFDPDGASIQVEAGRKIRLERDSTKLAIMNVDPVAVGNWRGGRLAYDDAPLADVASDIFRLGGGSIEMDAALAQQRFTGTLMAGNRNTLASRAAELAGLEARQVQGRWRFSKRTDTTH